MARTLNGNFTGQAARIEKQEFLDYLQDARRQEIKRNKDSFTFFLDELKRIDPQGWEAWYDSDAIPNYLAWLDIEPVIETIRLRIHALRPNEPPKHMIVVEKTDQVITVLGITPKNIHKVTIPLSGRVL